MPGRPSASGFSTAAAASPATGLSWSHTAVAGRALYVIVHSTLNGLGASQPTASYGGVPLRPWFQGAEAFVGSASAWVFSLPAADVVPGTDTIDFDNSPHAANYMGQAFNVAEAPSDACIILPGFAFTPFATSFARRAYAWDALGLQIASCWGLGGALAIAEGTEIGNGNSGALNTHPAADTEILFTVNKAPDGYITLLSFLIPPDETTQPRTGGGFQPLLSGHTLLELLPVGDSANAGWPYGSASIEGRCCDLLLVPGTAHSWAIRSNMAPGAGETVEAEIYIGGGYSGLAESRDIPTGIALTLSDSDRVASRSDLAALLSWARYGRLVVRYTHTVGSGGLPAGFAMQSAVLIESGEDAAQVYGGGAQGFGGSVADTPFYTAPLHPAAGASWGSTAASDKSLVGIDAVQTELVVQRQENGVAAPNHQFYMEKRTAAAPLVGVLQDGSGGTVETEATYVADSLGPALARRRFSLAWAPGDLMGIVGYLRTGGAQSRHAAAIKVVARTRGEIMVSGHSTQTNGAVEYTSVPNGANGPSVDLADEDAVALIIPPMAATGDDFHVRGLRAYLESVGPDDGRDWTARLRQALANTSMPDLVLTGSPADPISGVVSGDVAYAGLDELSILFLLTNTPVLERQFWTIPGFIQPPLGRGVIGPHLWLKFPRTQPDVAT